MDETRERIVVVEADPASRDALQAALSSAGYDVTLFASLQEGLASLRNQGAGLLLLNVGIRDPGTLETVAAIRSLMATDGVRIIFLTGAGAEERAEGLEIGADDSISRPWHQGELLARVRAQFRARRAERDLREKTRIAEEGQQIAHTAFEALAVTEKMTSDAFSLERALKVGLGVFFAIAVLMAGIYFLFVRNAQKETRQANTIIARLERGLVHQQDLIAEARKLRGVQGTADALPAGKEALKNQAADLQARMQNADPSDVSSLQKELAETNARLKRVEEQGDSAAVLIPLDVRSVCLLHVSVAFRDRQSGQRLRYAGINPQGEPLEDSDGNPILTLEGHGPEVVLDVFGTGFLAGPNGLVTTNRHVAEPWWKNDELDALTTSGFQAEISSIHAYFPGDPRAFRAEVRGVSPEVDLATMHVEMQDLKRPILPVESGKSGAVSGEPIVLMGYATGLAAILARADDDTAQQIASHSGGDVSQVLDELAKRNLIRPLITQGHIGDVLPDKIVFDAQTTSGGSGGPLFNREGKVIGVTYAVLKGFGGSSFGIPIRFSLPLLASASTSTSTSAVALPADPGN